MSIFDIARACVQRCEHGAGAPLTLTQAVEQVQHPLAGLNQNELHQVIAYLACQLIGAEASRDANAGLAMHQIARIVAQYAERQPYTLRAAEVDVVEQLAIAAVGDR